MDLRTLLIEGGRATSVERPPSAAERFSWIDVLATAPDVADVLAVTDPLGLDSLAVRDAITDVDLPKVDDFGDHLLAVFHGLRDDRVATYEVHCFLTAGCLVTLHDRPSPAIDAVWEFVCERSPGAPPAADLLLAMVADSLTRRLMGVVDTFDDHIEALVARALAADPDVLEDLSVVRADIARVRRTVHPQREALDVARRSESPLVTDAGRRKLSDVFDVALRASTGLDDARSALADTLDAYRGAEARAATEVTKVLTVFAAILLPQSLIAGFFGMNFANLPWVDTSWGWIAATGMMVFVAAFTLGIFVALGWVRRPSGRRAGRAIGRGLIEATMAPIHVVGAVYEVSTTPIRATGDILTRRARIDSSTTDDPAD